MKINVFSKLYSSEEIEVSGYEEAISAATSTTKIAIQSCPRGLIWTPFKEDLFWLKNSKDEKVHPVIPDAEIAFTDSGVWVKHPLMPFFFIARPRANLDLDALSTTNRRIVSLFQKISLPFIKNVFEPKANTILRILKSAGVKAKYYKNIGIVVPAKKSRKCVVMSHMDLIFKFNSCFFFDESISIKDGIVQGALDNTITNAVLLDLILEGKINDDTEILLSVDEETGCNGSLKYIETFKQFDDVAFVNLDVTNEFAKKNVSIEYDKPNSEGLKFLNSLFKKQSIGITHNRMCDDLDSVHRKGLNGISFCLPTKGTIHSLKNETTLEQIEKYSTALETLLSRDCTALSKEQNISSWKKNAIKFSDEAIDSLVVSKKQMKKKARGVFGNDFFLNDEDDDTVEDIGEMDDIALSIYYQLENIYGEVDNDDDTLSTIRGLSIFIREHPDGITVNDLAKLEEAEQALFQELVQMGQIFPTMDNCYQYEYAYVY